MHLSRDALSSTSISQTELLSLLPNICSGEEAACVQVGRYFGPRFRAYFLYRRVSEFDAEVLALETVGQVILNANSVRRPDCFSSLAFSIARQRLAEHWRTFPPAAEQLEEVPNLLLVGSQNKKPTSRSARRVRLWLSKLAADDRRLMEARYSCHESDHFSKFSEGATTFKALAEELGISEANARKREQRLRQRLRKELLDDKRLTSEIAMMSKPVTPKSKQVYDERQS